MSTWKVPCINYPAQFHKMEDVIMETIRDVLSKGDLILRDHVRSFEENFDTFVGRKYAVATTSGTVALCIAIQGLGLEKENEVIIPDLTFVASPNSVILAPPPKPRPAARSRGLNYNTPNF